MAARDDVRKLLKQGMKQAEIASKLGISPGRVSQLVKEIRASAQAAAPSHSPRKQNHRPPPPGPHGTAFKKGNPGGPGVPPEKAMGNKNAVKTGEFETIFADALDDDELEIYAGIDTDSIKQAEEEVRLLTIRERRMMQRIAGLKSHQFTIVEESHDEETTIDPEEKGDSLKVKSRKRSTKHMGTLGQIQAIEDALTRVQERKRSAIELLHKLRDGGGPGKPDVSAYVAALNAKAGDVWADEKAEVDDSEDGDDA